MTSALRYLPLVLLSFFLNWGTAELVAQQIWPQWRNSDFSSVGDADVPTEFGTEKNMLWRVPLPGGGGASPVVAADRVFVTSAIGKQQSTLICVSTSGEELWQHKYEQKIKMRGDGATPASPSPVTDGKHVWAMMASGELKCFTVDGGLVWEKDIQKEYGKFEIMFGYSSTPVLHEGKLYLMVIDGDMRATPALTSEGQLICLDAKTGTQQWVHTRSTNASQECLHSYASPTIYRDGDRTLLLIQGADYLTAHDLDSGDELWRCGGMNPKGRSYNQTFRLVASPAVGDGRIVVPTAKNGPILCLKSDGKNDVTDDKSVNLWRLPKGTPDVSTPVVHDGIVYLVAKKGIFSALDLADGKLLYRERLLADKHRSTPVVAGDKVIVAGRDGTVVVVKAGKRFEVLAENKLGEDTTASPAIANNVLFIRTAKALYAFGTE